MIAEFGSPEIKKAPVSRNRSSHRLRTKAHERYDRGYTSVAFVRLFIVRSCKININFKTKKKNEAKNSIKDADYILWR